jgi:hypothetical protein
MVFYRHNVILLRFLWYCHTLIQIFWSVVCWSDSFPTFRTIIVALIFKQSQVLFFNVLIRNVKTLQSIEKQIAVYSSIQRNVPETWMFSTAVVRTRDVDCC